MTDRLTAEQLGKIRQRVMAATRGEWHAMPENDNGVIYIEWFSDGDGGPVCGLDASRPHDAVFIAAARKDVPDLLGHIAALEAERDELQKRLGYARETIGGLRRQLDEDMPKVIEFRKRCEQLADQERDALRDQLAAANAREAALRAVLEEHQWAGYQDRQGWRSSGSCIACGGRHHPVSPYHEAHCPVKAALAAAARLGWVSVKEGAGDA